MGKAIFKANVYGADRQAREFGEAASAIPRVVRRDFQNELAGDLTGMFRDAAPYDFDGRDNYHLQDNIDANMSRGGGIRVTVTAEARSPESGYDYLDVTRYGHAGTIFPVRKRKLKWTQNGQRIVRPYSAGSTVAGDWVEEGAAAADSAVDEAEGRIGRGIERVIG